MSGLLALLDDVAAIAKVAAASVDDIVAATAKAGSKAAGIVIDDAAVTPKYVHGFAADRELPIIWKIARGSAFNKIVLLLPGLMALNYFLPTAITPLLMIGGAYLCFEGAEKVFHALFPHGDEAVDEDFDPRDPAHLEEERVGGAIKTDFILSAEIMVIALSTLPAGDGVVVQGVTLAVVGLLVTVAVYGAVALIVKMDDVGLHMASKARLAATRALGRGLVLAMPKLMSFLSTVGTLAMLWVGGSIVLHGLEVTHLWAWPYETIQLIAQSAAQSAAQSVPFASGFVAWAVQATLDGIFGLGLGILLIPLATRLIGPVWAGLTGRNKRAH